MPPLDGGLLAGILIVLDVILLGAVIYLWRRRPGVGSTPVPQEERSWLNYGSFFVVLCSIGAVIIGFLSVLLFLDKFGDVTQALGFMTAFFGAVVGLAGTYFGIKTSSDAAAGAQKLVAAAGARDTTEPEVVSVTPGDNDKNVPPETKPTATFSKDMDAVTINADTFKLIAIDGDQTDVKPVQPAHPDGVQYDSAKRVANFIPADGELERGKRYAATITSSVKDKAGNALGQDKAWHFTTEPPPALQQEQPTSAGQESQ
jgi:hypothetical protein